MTTYFYPETPPENNIVTQAVIRLCEARGLPVIAPNTYGHNPPANAQEYDDITKVAWPSGLDANESVILGPRPAGYPEWRDVVEEMHKINAEGVYFTYQRLRKRAYPDVGQYLDAFVKGDENAMEQYKLDCLAVKESIPKKEELLPPHMA